MHTGHTTRSSWAMATSPGAAAPVDTLLPLRHILQIRRFGQHPWRLATPPANAAPAAPLLRLRSCHLGVFCDLAVLDTTPGDWPHHPPLPLLRLPFCDLGVLCDLGVFCDLGVLCDLGIWDTPLDSGHTTRLCRSGG
jgi:hypothetical protein